MRLNLNSVREERISDGAGVMAKCLIRLVCCVSIGKAGGNEIPSCEDGSGHVRYVLLPR